MMKKYLVLMVIGVVAFSNSAVYADWSQYPAYDWTSSSFDWSNWNSWRNNISDLTAADYVYDIAEYTKDWNFPEDQDKLNAFFQSFTNITPLCRQTDRVDSCQFIHTHNRNFNYTICPCSTCTYSSVLRDLDIGEMTGVAALKGNIVYNQCCRYAADYSGCADSDWTLVASTNPQRGYQKYLVKEADCLSGACSVVNTYYRCAPGYYGLPVVSNNTYSGCTKCPSYQNIDATSTPNDFTATPITACFLEKNFSNAAGSGVVQTTSGTICRYSN